MEHLSTIAFDIIIEFLLIIILYSNRITRSLYRLGICSLIFVICAISVVFLPEILFAPIDFILEMVFVWILMQEKWYKKILSFFLVYILDSLVYQAFALIFDLIFKLPIFVGINTIKEKCIIKAFSALILTVFLIIKTKKHYNFSLSISNKFFLCLYTGTICIILTLFQINQNLINGSFLYLFALLCITSSSIVIVYILLSSQKNISSANLKKQEQYVNILKQYYNENQQNNTEIRKLKHDMRNHINVLGQLIETGNFNEALNYIHQIDQHNNDKTITITDTGNVLLNAILMQKRAEFSNINIVFKGAIDNNIGINDYDFCTILNNLLDNALEYSIKHNFDSAQLYLYQESSILLINVANTVLPDTTISKFDFTTKSDNTNHGLGLSIVREAISHYHGHLEFEHEENMLTAKVQLFLPPNSHQ